MIFISNIFGLKTRNVMINNILMVYLKFLVTSDIQFKNFNNKRNIDQNISAIATGFPLKGIVWSWAAKKLKQIKKIFFADLAS